VFILVRHNSSELWDHNKYHKTIPLDKSNIALMRSAPGFDSFMVFATKFEQMMGEEEMTCLPVTTVSDDEGYSEEEMDDPDNTRGERVVEREGDHWLGQIRRHPDLPDDIFPDKQLQREEGMQLSKQEEEWMLFLDAEEEEADDPTVHVVPEDEDTQSNSAQAQLLVWHYRLGHVSFD
jgi:hypothetical protein